MSACKSFDPTPLFARRLYQWKPAAIRSLLAHCTASGMIPLVAGKPSPETFPIAKISITLKGPDHHVLSLEGESLNDALQYGMPEGDANLVSWFEEFQRTMHGMSIQASWSCCIGSGCQDLLYKAFLVFSDEGDTVLVEAPGYSGTIDLLKGCGRRVMGVACDADGLSPFELERVLTDWPENSRRPTVLYTVPTGSNPTGRSCTESRKKEILRLAQRFNFMIFEDDAYYFLDYSGSASRQALSYLALEREVHNESGRVVRFDSFSKILCPGLRLGVLTGSPLVVDMVTRITGHLNLQPCSSSQAIALALLRHWGPAGLLAHCAQVSNFYRRKRDAFNLSAERFLSGRATWQVPTAGMFFWMTLLLPPGYDSSIMVSQSAVSRGVLAIPGVAFMPEAVKTHQIRVSFSLASDDELEEACRRIAALVDEAWSTSKEIALAMTEDQQSDSGQEDKDSMSSQKCRDSTF